MRRIEAAAMALVIGGGALAPWLVDALTVWGAALTSGLAGAGLAVGFLHAGWWGRRRIVGLSWTSDDRWLATLQDGRLIELTLDLHTRVSPYGFWLRWTADGSTLRRRAMLLSHLDIPPADLRRVAARLRLDAQWAHLRRGASLVVAA